MSVTPEPTDTTVGTRRRTFFGFEAKLMLILLLGVPLLALIVTIAVTFYKNLTGKTSQREPAAAESVPPPAEERP